MTEVNSILASANQMLDVARLGLRLYAAADDDRFAGIFNVASGGRSVTFAIQRLKGKVDGFTDWYGPIQDDMREDEVFQWFKALRNKIEKQGESRIGSNSSHIKSLNTSDLYRYAPPLAAGASLGNCAIGDPLGRSYWIIRLPDGTEERSYFELPEEVATLKLTMEGDHDGRDFGELASYYIDKLTTIVNDAVARFGSPPK